MVRPFWVRSQAAIGLILGLISLQTVSTAVQAAGPCEDEQTLCYAVAGGAALTVGFLVLSRAQIIVDVDNAEVVTPAQVRAELEAGPTAGRSRSNIAFAAVKGVANSAMTVAALAISRKLPAAQLLPVAAAVFGASGGYQAKVDFFHKWLTSGSWTARLGKPGLRGAEPYAKFFVMEFCFLMIINGGVALSHALPPISLGALIAKTAQTAAFAVYSEGFPEIVIVERTSKAAEKIKTMLAGLPEGDPQIAVLQKKLARLDTVRRLGSMALGVVSTAIASSRNAGISRVDWGGLALIGIGTVGAALQAKTIFGSLRETVQRWKRSKCSLDLTEKPAA